MRYLIAFCLFVSFVRVFALLNIMYVGRCVFIFNNIELFLHFLITVQDD